MCLQFQVLIVTAQLYFQWNLCLSMFVTEEKVNRL